MVFARERESVHFTSNIQSTRHSAKHKHGAAKIIYLCKYCWHYAMVNFIVVAVSACVLMYDSGVYFFILYILFVRMLLLPFLTGAIVLIVVCLILLQHSGNRASCKNSELRPFTQQHTTIFSASFFVVVVLCILF